MRQAEETEAYLLETAKALQCGLLRVGSYPSVNAHWMPDILTRFRRKYPETTIKLKIQLYYREAEIGIRGNKRPVPQPDGAIP